MMGLLVHPAQDILPRGLEQFPRERNGVLRQRRDLARDLAGLDLGVAGATTALTKPASRASSALTVRPITSMAKAR